MVGRNRASSPRSIPQPFLAKQREMAGKRAVLANSRVGRPRPDTAFPEQPGPVAHPNLLMMLFFRAMSSVRAALSSLNLTHPPVAVAFMAAPPDGLTRVPRPDPASCGYWKQASEGRAFYTTADDHQNCPVGAFTHGVALSPAKRQELEGLVGTMVELKYLRAEEVPQIPHRTSPLQVAAYAPLEQAGFRPDVVIFRGTPRQIMLISEAARRAGAPDESAVMGRPACAMLPKAIDAPQAVTSVGCIGNRVYTGLDDNDLYLSVPGGLVDRVLAEIPTIVNANVELEKFHRARAQALG